MICTHSGRIKHTIPDVRKIELNSVPPLSQILGILGYQDMLYNKTFSLFSSALLLFYICSVTIVCGEPTRVCAGLHFLMETLFPLIIYSQTLRAVKQTITEHKAYLFSLENALSCSQNRNDNNDGRRQFCDGGKI
jgi:hypothetical protein